MTDKEKAFEYDEEFVKKLEVLKISVIFNTSKDKRLNSDSLKLSAYWGFYAMKEARQVIFARMNIAEYGANTQLSEFNVFDILGFQAAMEVLNLIADKEKQLNEILKK